MIDFKDDVDRDLFVSEFNEHVVAASKPVGEFAHSGTRPAARAWMDYQESFEFSYILGFNDLAPAHFGRLGAQVCEMADLITGNERSAYCVCFFDNEISISFKDEWHRYEFANSIKEAATKDEIIDSPPSEAASPRLISVH